MSAKNDIFEQYSLEEISKKTKISPISLRFIKNKEYDKIPRVKFIGFINILQREFKTDLSHLIEEYDLYAPSKPEKTEKITPPTVKEEKKSPIIYLFLTFALIITGIVLYKTVSAKPQKPAKAPEIAEINQTPVIELSKETNDTENNLTQKQPATNKIVEINQTLKTSQTKEINVTQKTSFVKEPPKTQPKPVKKLYSAIIIPQKKVWLKATNLDTNKSRQYIISKSLSLPKGNYYIKFGHGLVKILYNQEVIEPNTKRILKIKLINGKYEIISPKTGTKK